ncbi:hypothetical protein [Methylobacterium oxalidis]|uniref:hypothetical protein n=1 Tax=Methylobacterium oxalidis TaxID=944322 RepID=UPI00331497B0
MSRIDKPMSGRRAGGTIKLPAVLAPEPKSKAKRNLTHFKSSTHLSREEAVVLYKRQIKARRRKSDLATAIAALHADLHGRPVQAPAQSLMDMARARAAALKPGFTHWVKDLPDWPEGEPEVLGPQA